MDSSDWVTSLSTNIGISAPALRLLLSLLFSYPLALFHRQYLFNHQSPIIQHIFFIITGSYIGYFNYGTELLHAYICILVQYIIVTIFKAQKFTILFSFIFQLSYLLILYILTESDSYDIKWTIPHCVLTLRLIGQAFDIYDGGSMKELSNSNTSTSSQQQQSTALKTIPNLFETMGHVFYPGSFMIGPQFPLKRYLDFVNGKLLPINNMAQAKQQQRPPPTIKLGLEKLSIGILYSIIYQIGSQYINDDYIQSIEFQLLPFWKKLLLIGLDGKILVYKYVSCWVIIEGACIWSGISYNGKKVIDNNNKQASTEITTTTEEVYNWDACENINIKTFETSYKFTHIISSFNKCTNTWIANNIYKRIIKQTGQRYLAQIASLLFLAIWHGFHSGYYVCFLLEFLVIKMEKDLSLIFSKNSKISYWHTKTKFGYYFDLIILKIIVFIFFGYCFLPFSLLTFDKWWNVYKDIYFIGFFVFGLWPIYSPLVRILIPADLKDVKEGNINNKGSMVNNNNNNNRIKTQ